MPSCVVKGCKNYDTKVKKEHGISYHRFPNDLDRKEIWSRIIRKQRKEPYFKPHKNTRVCSAHFCDKDFDISKSGLRRLKESAIPRFEIKVCKDEELRPSTPASHEEEMEYVDIIDINSIVDSPKEVQLKTRIKKLKKHQIDAAKKIRNLMKQNGRLKRKNKSLLDVIKDLKQKNYVSTDKCSKQEVKKEEGNKEEVKKEEVKKEEVKKEEVNHS